LLWLFEAFFCSMYIHNSRQPAAITKIDSIPLLSILTVKQSVNSLTNT
jgi:hypothetical protein